MMNKFITLSVTGITLLNLSVMPVSAFSVNGSDDTEVIVSQTENTTTLVVSGSEDEDLVLRLFDNNNSLVYTDVITAPNNTAEDDIFQFERPDKTVGTYTAVINGESKIKTVTIKYASVETPSRSPGGGGGGTSMTISSDTWDSSIDKLASKIDNVTDDKSAEKVVKDITDATKTETTTVEDTEKRSEKVSLTVEEAASRANAKSLDASSNILALGAAAITEANVSSLKKTLSNLQSTVSKGNVQLNRELFSEYVLNTKFNENKTATIRITKGLMNNIRDLDTLTIADDNFRVSYKVSELVDMLGDKNSIDIVVEQPKTNEEGTIKKLKIDFNTENVNTMKVSFPGIDGNSDYMSVVDENGNPVGGKYNPLTGCIEAKINAAGVYSVIINEKDFIDIKNMAAETQEAIKVLAAKGIIEGTSETEFEPDNSITRAEIAALMLRILAKNDPNEDGGFADVTQQNWYFGTAGSSKKYGLIEGYEDNTFRGDKVILNDQLVVIAARLLKEEMRYLPPKNLDDYLTFSDKSDIADWAREGIATARMADIVLMNSDGAFHSTESMTRANAALIIKRMYDKIK